MVNISASSWSNSWIAWWFNISTSNLNCGNISKMRCSNSWWINSANCYNVSISNLNYANIWILSSSNSCWINTYALCIYVSTSNFNWVNSCIFSCSKSCSITLSRMFFYCLNSSTWNINCGNSCKSSCSNSWSPPYPAPIEEMFPPDILMVVTFPNRPVPIPES